MKQCSVVSRRGACIKFPPRLRSNISDTPVFDREEEGQRRRTISGYMGCLNSTVRCQLLDSRILTKMKQHRVFEPGSTFGFAHDFNLGLGGNGLERMANPAGHGTLDLRGSRRWEAYLQNYGNELDTYSEGSTRSSDWSAFPPGRSLKHGQQASARVSS
ncbi:hypothetical protein MAPG_09174 [Magnaporthiopsis poae ATCC 64411]|uniref:Uncharacterized protein n=1 Tax=Magnaporthiopsis poae (strain ATCC 64411 / 73-15) TaxID=644358 RepID=A0A0C4E995_MAGP6|nr:hypothetical protein MAPG_09174 [Magnaporthiopsis poae ATCC 64411]